jgi:hypothetical protein
MLNDYKIIRMNQQQLNIAIDWAADEGWNPGLNDAETFYQTDPNGFFAGVLNQKIIAVGSAVIYDEHFAFCGFYIVDSLYRDQGYGLELTKARLNYIGKRNAGIDGVMEMVDKYSLIGYKFAHNNARYVLESHQLHPKENTSITPISAVNFDDLCTYDRDHFPAFRSIFLRSWINQKQAKAVAYIAEGQIHGYGVIRTCQTGFKIGPLFANDFNTADCLFRDLASYAQGKSIFLDIPEPNQAAIDLVRHYGMHKVFATARMYLKEEPQINMHEIYGITSFELG